MAALRARDAGVANNLDEAKAAFRAAEPLSEGVDEDMLNLKSSRS